MTVAELLGQLNRAIDEQGLDPKADVFIDTDRRDVSLVRRRLERVDLTAKSVGFVVLR